MKLKFFNLRISSG